MLICNRQLDEKQLKEIEALAAECQKTDGGAPAIYYHLLRQRRDSESNVLDYDDSGNLVGFLSVYFFYDDACEISLLVSPEHRRYGVASKMLRTIMPLLHTKKMASLIFSSGLEHDKLMSLSGKAARFVYKYSEYHMQRNGYEPVIMGYPALFIREATDSDLTDLCVIDSACFDSQNATMQERFEYLLADRNYTILLALRNNKPIGKAHIRWQTDGAIFSDIAIIPQEQGKGLGGELLSYCINQSLSMGKNKITLDVETNNSNALNLYLRHGFKTATRRNFWSISTSELELSLA
ncbi:GNAT family N-acetyltransferase [Legionella dresdenensis]|uniref:GNAT family N-acetyltransferase n=1 Tax=Legionella dresdenensis TaxID=450200 RepID=A0ABV8CHN5_9GAMM